MKSKANTLLLVLIALLLVYQMVVSWTTYIRPTASSSWNFKSEPAWARSGYLLLGDQTTDHLRFLRELLPEGSRVVLPPHSGGGIYENIGLMQYFLIPRDIVNCGRNEVKACIRRVTGGSTYILAAGNFPPRELAEESKRFIEFDEDLGVYVPE